MQNRSPRDLPVWLWLITPFLILLVQIAARSGDEARYEHWMRGEISVVELGTVFWGLIALAAALFVLLRPHAHLSRPITLWLALFSLGALYFAGEEASWGQHYFGWSTPEAWAKLNDQEETGLHNISGVFDQAPRTALTIAAALAIVIAWRARRAPERFGPGTRWYWLWPTYVCIPSALLALAIGLPHKYARESLPNWLDLQPGEFKEYFFAMFLAMYALSIAVRSAGESREPRAA